MHEVYKNIKNERIRRGWTQDDLAKRVGYSEKSIISRIEAGKVDLPQSKVEEFAKVFGTSPAYLMGWTVTDDQNTSYEIEFRDREHEKKTAERLRAYYISVLGMSAAGKPIEAEENKISEVEVPYVWSNRDEYFGLQIKGDSMEPAICNNDIVIVHKQEDAESGEIVIASVGQNDATCKRLMKYGETILLRSYNQAYDDIDVTGDENFKIYGKVVESRRKYE